MNRRHRRTLERIFERPTRADIRWSEIESLFNALGAIMSEGRGSRIRIELNGRDHIIHKPHPRPEMDKGAVMGIKDFLEKVGMKP